MTWINTLKSAVPDLTPENEDGLISLLADPQFVSFFAQAFRRLTQSQQEAVAKTAKTALEVVSPRLQHALVGFAENIRAA